VYSPEMVPFPVLWSLPLDWCGWKLTWKQITRSGLRDICA